jgi:hypothetical protein
MSKPTVTIDLRPGPWPDGEHRFMYPVGSVIRGSATINAPEATKIRAITASAVWRTEGRGTEDRGAADTVTLHEQNLNAGDMLRREFTVNIPKTGPISYNGTYVSILWAVEIRIDIPWAIDVFEYAEITVVPEYVHA